MVSLFFTALIILNDVSIHFLSNLDHDFLVHLFVFWCISHCLFFLLKTENACLHHILKNAHILHYMNYNGTHFTVECVHHRTVLSNFLQLHFKLATHLSTYNFFFFIALLIQAHCFLDTIASLFLDSFFISLEYNLKQYFRNYVEVKSFKLLHSEKESLICSYSELIQKCIT